MMTTATMTTTQQPPKDRRIQTGVDSPSYLREQNQRLIEDNNRLREKIKELNKAMADTDNARVEQQQHERALTLYGESEAVKSLTNRLNYLLPNASEIGTQAVALVAQIAIAHGLDPLPGSDHVYAWKQGQKLIVSIGYKGLLHLARKQVYFTFQSRPMTDEEREEHGLNDKEIGYITTLYEIAKVKECKELGIPYYPIIGVAKWKPGDNVCASKTPAWHAKKNSLKDALRQITSTGERMQSALDEAFIEQARRLGYEASVTGDGIVIEMPEERDADELQELIEAGLVEPNMIDGEVVNGDTGDAITAVYKGEVIDQQPPAEADTDTGTAPTCATEGCNEPADPLNPYDAELCSAHANAAANADAAKTK